MKNRYGLLNLVVVGLLASSSALAGLIGEGGVSGGGGNSRTSGFLSSSEVANVIATAKTSTLLAARLVGHLYLAHQDQMPAALMKIYGQPGTLEKALDQLKIRIKTSSPCYGNDGSFNDGWFDPAAPNEICLSAALLSKKVPASEVNSQVIALIMHEVSHSLGLNEKEATEYQDLILKYAYVPQELNQNYPNEKVFELMDQFTRGGILKTAEGLRTGNTVQQCQLSKDLIGKAVAVSVQSVFLNNSGLVLETYASFKFVALQYKLMNYVASSCYLMDPSNADSAKEYQFYQAVFARAGKNRLSMSEFAAALGLGLRYNVVDVSVPQIQTPVDLNAEATSIADLVNELYLDVAKTEDLVRRSFIVVYQN